MRGLVIALVLAGVPRVHADDKPWVTGVTEQAKADAKVLLDRGNAKFVERDYVSALELYKQAVAKWDHPAIRFNMVRCLIQLDRTVEANENLTLALKYGAAPLEEAVYREALTYQKLLANEVGTVRVRCEQAGVKITLDGELLVDCPGEQERRVKPGRHQLVGAKAGFLTKTADVFVIGGGQEQVAVSLAPMERGVVVHRWPTWMPWVVVGAGLTLTSVGGLIEYQSFKTMDDYDRALVAACVNTGCTPERPVPDHVRDLKDTAKLQNAIAIGALTVGVATVITGGVLVYMNRARTVYPTAEVVPLGATVSLNARF
ncbi:MAG TPA: tetratricopeptide repeat protein [Kofleriaceae bacterium]